MTDQHESHVTGINEILYGQVIPGVRSTHGVPIIKPDWKINRRMVFEMRALFEPRLVYQHPYILLPPSDSQARPASNYLTLFLLALATALFAIAWSTAR
jgi:hypothetical protein